MSENIEQYALRFAKAVIAHRKDWQKALESGKSNRWGIVGLANLGSFNSDSGWNKVEARALQREAFNLLILQILDHQRQEKLEFEVMDSHYTEAITARDMVAHLCSWPEGVQQGLDELCKQGLVTTENDCHYKLASRE